MSNDVTNDMSRFGYRELDMAGDILKAFKGNNDDDKDCQEYLEQIGLVETL